MLEVNPAIGAGVSEAKTNVFRFSGLTPAVVEATSPALSWAGSAWAANRTEAEEERMARQPA